MRRFAPVLLALSLTASVVAAVGTQTAPSVAQGPSYLDVIADSAIHRGARVSWVASFRTMIIELGPGGSVSKDRTVFTLRGGGATLAQLVVGPPIHQMKWTEAASRQTEAFFQFQPHLISGAIEGVQQITGPGGALTPAVVLTDVTVDVFVPVSGAGAGTGGGGRGALGVVAPGNGVSWPVVLREEKPKYTPEAMRAKIQGSVELEIVVAADGSVSDVRVVKSLDQTYGLDDAAVEAAKRWRFKPGLKDGVAVPTRVFLALDFRLGRGGGPGVLLNYPRSPNQPGG